MESNKTALFGLFVIAALALGLLPTATGQENPTVSEPGQVPTDIGGSGEFAALAGANHVEVFKSGNHTYAMVAASGDNGIQIIDLTDPANPTPVSAVFDSSGGFDALNGVRDVEVFKSGNHTYAMVAASDDNAVQIMDITDPANPTPVSSVFDGSGGFVTLDGANHVKVFEIGNRTYAIVAALNEDGIQIMDITDPANPALVSVALDGSRGFDALAEANHIEVFESGNRTYAIVVALYDNAVQIMDITDPARPAPVSAVFDGSDGFVALHGPLDAEIFGIGNRTYAIVVAWSDEGIQIMDITDPARPAPVSAVLGVLGGLGALNWVEDVEVFGVRDRTYAMVVTRDDVVRIMDITDPARPAPVSAAFDDSDGFVALDGAADAEIFGIGNRTYAIVVAWNDDGVQIMDITDPANPAPVSAAFDGLGGFAMNGIENVEVFESESSTYAMVTATDDDGIQIINITDPANPAPVLEPPDGSAGFGVDRVIDAEVFGSGDRTYAIVSAIGDDGLRIMDITDPARPAPVTEIFDGSDGFDALNGVRNVEVFGIVDRTYAIAAAGGDNGLQIINITDPARPAPVSSVFDGSNGFVALNGVRDVEVFGSGKHTYALAASSYDDIIQIINITDPANPAPGFVVSDDLLEPGSLHLPFNVEVLGIGDGTYALVAAINEHDLQIINITDPARPTPTPTTFDGPVGFVVNPAGHPAEHPQAGDGIAAANDGYIPSGSLDGAANVEVFWIGNRTYAIVVAWDDDVIHIMNITDPDLPAPVTEIFDGSGGFAALAGVHEMEVFGSGGSIYTLVAAADDDAIHIINITDPTHPAPVSSVFDGSGGFAALDWVSDIEVFGSVDRTYAIMAAAGDDGVNIMDITDPANPAPVSSVFDGSGGFAALDGVRDVEVFGSGNRTYAIATAVDDGGIQIMDITDPARPVPVTDVLYGSGGFIPMDGEVDVEVFGSGNHTYAIMAAPADDAIHIVNITDPARPVPVSLALDGSRSFHSLGGPANVEVFQSGGRTYAAVVALSEGWIRVMDITDPVNPRSSSGSSGWVKFGSLYGTADLEVFVSGDGVYAIAPTYDSGVMTRKIHDYISHDPSSPAPVQDAFEGPRGFDALGGAHDVKVFGSGDRTYAIVVAYFDGGIQIMDVTDPAHPAPVSSIFADSEGFDALDGARNVEVFGSGDRTYAIVATDDGIQIIDITDLTHPTPVSAAADDWEGFVALAGAGDVEVFGIGNHTYAIVAAGGDDGVQIINITNPTHPAPVSAAVDDWEGFDALAGARGVEVFGSGNYTYAIVTATGDSGIQIINITDPANPAPVLAVFDGWEGRSLSGATGVVVFENMDRTYAIVTTIYGIQIIDITNPAHPVPVSLAFDDWEGFDALYGARNTVFGIGDRTYAIAAAWGDGGVQIMDITNPAHPVPVSSVFDGSGGFDALDLPSSVKVIGSGNHTYALVTSVGDDGIQIINITDPANPAPVLAIFDDVSLVPEGPGGLDTVDQPTNVEVFGIGNRTYAIVTALFDGVAQIMDLTNPAHPSPISAVFDGTEGLDALFNATAMEVFGIGDRTYAIAALDNEIRIMDLTNPAHPSPISAVPGGTGGFGTLLNATAMEVFGIGDGTYAIAVIDNEIRITDLTNPAHPSPISAVPGGTGGFDALFNVFDLEVFESGDGTYAIVGAYNDDGGLQIINITEPAHPSPISAVFDGTEGLNPLGIPARMEVFRSGGGTYAIVTIGDGIQIVDLTNPAHPTLVSVFYGDSISFRAQLNSVIDLDVFGSGDRTYAVISSVIGTALIMDLTNPAHPAHVSDVSHSVSESIPFTLLFNVEVFGSGDRTYIVTSFLLATSQITDITDPAHPTPISTVIGPVRDE